MARVTLLEILTSLIIIILVQVFVNTVRSMLPGSCARSVLVISLGNRPTPVFVVAIYLGRPMIGKFSNLSPVMHGLITLFNTYSSNFYPHHLLILFSHELINWPTPLCMTSRVKLFTNTLAHIFTRTSVRELSEGCEVHDLLVLILWAYFWWFRLTHHYLRFFIENLQCE